MVTTIATKTGPAWRLALLLLAATLLVTGSGPARAQQEGINLEVPDVLLRGVPFTVRVKDPSGMLAEGSVVTVTAAGQSFDTTLAGGEATVEDVVLESAEASFSVDAADGSRLAGAHRSTLAGWMALLPALLAIIIALALRQVVPALFLGIWVGGTLVHGLTPAGAWFGLLDTVSTYTLGALDDAGHLSVILFSLMIGGMVGVISRNGGTRGIVNLIIGWARSARRGQISTAVLGTAIFFDDYANTLIVGNTMRPVTDRLRISREKLAYLVDSTAAPVATLALVTTWIGFQVGVIDEAVRGIEGYDESAYSIFLNSIVYNFYPLLTLVFVYLVALSGRDFGPMLAAERRARETGAVMRAGAKVGESPAEAEEREPKSGAPQRAINAVLPVLVLLVGSLAGIYITGAGSAGADAGLREIIGNGDSYQAMMWASLLAVAVAAVLSLGQRILSLAEVVDAWYAGVRSMLLAIIILVLAWALSGVNDALHTGDFLVTALGESLSPALLPALVFALSAFTAFATGSSWGVMGIMMPLVIPLTWAVMVINGMTEGGDGLYILYASVSAVLAGAVFGDHCSPISDTTILSSLASGCDHVDHVRTQLPYAATVGLVAIVLGLLPVGLGLPWWLALPIAAAVIYGVVQWLGKPVVDSSATSTD